MKALVGFLVSISISAPVFAGTNLMISKDSSQASILMLAARTNPDAVAFNDVLAMDAVDESGKWTKHFQFASSSGERLLSLACVFSKLVSDTGSCTVIVYASSYASIDKANQKVSLRVSDADGERLADQFRLSIADASGLIFRSSDGLLQVKAEGLQAGKGTGLEITYGH